jgi:hypothetical protein
MKKWYKVGIMALLALGALALAVSGIAYAQEEQPAASEESTVLFHGRGFGRGLHSEVALQAAAEALGMTPEELSTQLWGGKTLADLAEENGVALEEVQAAVEAALETALRDRIAQAVENGAITQEHADWLLEGLDQGFIGGFGGGIGKHGFHIRGGFGLSPAFESVTPSGDA